MSAPERTSGEQHEGSDIRRRAAGWLARRQGGFTADHEHEFERWLAADPRHRAAVAEMESAWNVINAPVAGGRGEELRRGLAAHARRQTARRRQRFFASLGVAAAAAVMFAFLPWQKNSAPAPALAPTMAFRPDQQTLPDGSLVECNVGAEIAVEFTAEKRGVRLLRGEAHFVVRKDPSRPFVVSAGAVDVKAVGTAFAVRFDPQQVDVLVTHGRVAVERLAPAADHPAASDAAAEPIYLERGARVAVPAGLPSLRNAKVEPLSPAEVTRALAWRERRIEFSDTPLAEAVELFNRQNRMQIAVANRADEGRRINGVFWADDPAGFARLLEVSLGMTMERQGEVIVLRSR